MPQVKPPPRYSAYLLRCWQERDSSIDVSATWRFSLEDSRTGKRQGFADLESLMQYLPEALQEDDSEVWSAE
jgi:hypothetical protein